MTDTQELAAEASARRDNAHIFFCDFHQQRRYYTVCLHLIEATRVGRLDDQKTDETSCTNAICRGHCEAVKMREAELSENRALYFKQRLGSAERPLKDSIDYQSRFGSSKTRGYKLGWNRVGSAIGNVNDNFKIDSSVLDVESKVQSSFGTTVDYGQAVNQALNEARASDESISLQEFLRLRKELEELMKANKKVEAQTLFRRLKHLKDNNLIKGVA
jgi:hypothetical protein